MKFQNLHLFHLVVKLTSRSVRSVPDQMGSARGGLQSIAHLLRKPHDYVRRRARPAPIRVHQLPPERRPAVAPRPGRGNVSKPITPEEAARARTTTIPSEVFDAFNDCITRHLSEGSATFTQDEVVTAVLATGGGHASRTVRTPVARRRGPLPSGRVARRVRQARIQRDLRRYLHVHEAPRQARLTITSVIAI